MDYLDQHQIEYKKVDVRVSDSGMQKLQDISGQTKTPTMDWEGDVLADFGTEDLEPFLKKHATS